MTDERVELTKESLDALRNRMVSAFLRYRSVCTVLDNWNSLAEQEAQQFIDAILASQPERVECPTNHTFYGMPRKSWRGVANFCPGCGEPLTGTSEYADVGPHTHGLYSQDVCTLIGCRADTRVYIDSVEYLESELNKHGPFTCVPIDQHRTQIAELREENVLFHNALRRIAQYHPNWTGQHVTDFPDRAKLIDIAFQCLNGCGQSLKGAGE